MRVRTRACEHGVSFKEFCEPCAHHPQEEWVGYPMTICAWEVVPWPCEYERNRRRAVPERGEP